MSLLHAEGFRCQPSKDACPVIADILPRQCENDGTISFLFPQNTLIRRIFITLKNPIVCQSVDVAFTWVGVGNWGRVAGILVVKSDGGPNCFFLGNESGIPPDIPVDKFQLKIPPGVELKEVVFSRLLSGPVTTICPMPDLEKEINSAYDIWKSNPIEEKIIDNLLRVLEKAIPRYDCRREIDSEPVPAWWLADYRSNDNWIAFMTTVLDAGYAPALRLFMEFFRTSDGYIAEGMTWQIVKMINSDPIFILENWGDLKNYKESVFGIRKFLGQDDIDRLTTMYRDISHTKPSFSSACAEIIEGLNRK